MSTPRSAALRVERELVEKVPPGVEMSTLPVLLSTWTAWATL